MEILQPPEILFHGTPVENVDSIFEKGILKGKRLYVHLSGDIETALKVGQRHGKPVVYVVDSGKMAEDGFVFRRSVNGVWLTDEVPVKYLRKLVK